MPTCNDMLCFRSHVCPGSFWGSAGSCRPLAVLLPAEKTANLKVAAWDCENCLIAPVQHPAYQRHTATYREW